MADRDVTLKLNLDAAGIKAGSTQIATAFDAIDKSLASQKQHLVGIRAQLADTTGLRERVKLTLEQEKAQRELNKAVAEERKKQEGGGGLLSKLLGKGKKDGDDEKGGGLGAAAVGAAAGLFALKSVALASPGAMEKFQIVMEDTAAVVGRVLTPILEIVTQAFKLIGDVLASILPSAGDMREAMKPISDLFGSIREALAPLAPFIKDVLVVALKALGVAIEIILLPFKLLAKLISALFGGGEDKKLKDSTGTAARNISFTSADAHAKSVYQAAFKAGSTEPTGEYQGPLQTIIKVLEEISKFVLGIAEKLSVKGLTGGGAAGGGEVGGLLKGKIKSGVEDMKLDTQKAFYDGRMSAKERSEMLSKAKEIKNSGKEREVPEWLREELSIREKTGDAGRDKWLSEQIDQAKRRALDGHPGGR